MADEDYLKILKQESDYTKDYYQKFLATKSEQQKMLENILAKQKISPKKIADIACGGGTLTFHISKIFNQAEYYLVDLNEEAIELAKKNLGDLNAKFIVESIYDLKSLPANYFDIVFCWQTLSWIDNLGPALKELIRITKKNGLIYSSSLFNTQHDVDIKAQIYDYTKASTKEGLSSNYFTYSSHTIRKIINELVKEFKIYEFNTEIDFDYNESGMGTYTVKLENGKRLQISGGLLMNWGILEIIK